MFGVKITLLSPPFHQLIFLFNEIAAYLGPVILTVRCNPLEE